MGRKANREVSVYRDSCPRCKHIWLTPIPLGGPRMWKWKCPKCKSPKIARSHKPLSFEGSVLIIWNEKPYK